MGQIDFSKLNSLGTPAEPREEPAGEPMRETPEEMYLAALREASAAGESGRADLMKQAHANETLLAAARSVCEEYREAHKKVTLMGSDIYKAINAGNPDYKALFLQACAMLSMCTHNNSFESMVHTRMVSISAMTMEERAELWKGRQRITAPEAEKFNNEMLN